MQEYKMNEDMLTKTDKRFTLFPIVHTDVWKMYKHHQSVDWKASEINYISDLSDWEKLTDNERFFIKQILAFFASADILILENLLVNFSEEVQWPEARAFYSFQSNIEMVHAEVYSLLIDTYIKDPDEKDNIFNAIERNPCVSKKAGWAMKWMNKERSFAERLVAFSVVEGIGFSGSFCAIFWLKSRGLMLNGLCKSNEFIARDENLHTEFSILLHNNLDNKLSEDEIREIFKEAVEIEAEFITESIPCKLIGMNSKLMIKYIEYVANFWITKLVTNTGKKCKKLYPDAKNPFDFMNTINIDGKTNFFEQTVSEYSTASSKTKVGNDEFENLDDDF